MSTPPAPPVDEPDWIDRLTSLAGSLGMNEVRVRWKLMAWSQWWQGLRHGSENVASHVGYEHKVCPGCGRINDKLYETCTSCGEPLLSRTWEILSRLGLVAPRGGLVSMLLGGAILVVYARLAVESPGTWVQGPPTAVLLRHGANQSQLIEAGQWWRLASACFLHIGLWHLVLNLAALSQIGPQVETAFGKGRALFLYMLTGIGANWISAQAGLWGVAAGASGAIMGLIGAAAGYGQRDGTRSGIQLRDQMLPWAAYTMLFGYGLGADNVAHGAGFALGAVLGYGLHPGWWRRRAEGPLDRVLGTLGAAALLAGVGLALFPR